MKYIIILLSFSFVLFSCETDSERRDRFFELGNFALEDGDYNKAIGLYDESLKVDPQFAMAINNKGVANMENDHPYEAILEYNQAILLEANYLDALFNRAYAYESIGKFDKALRDVDRIMTIKPDSAFVFFYKGLVQTKARQYKEAFISFNVADSLNPLNPETLINIATIHYFQNDLEKASTVLLQAMDLNSADPNISNLLSLINLKRKQYLAALIEVNRALDAVPDEPYFLNNRGFVYLEMDSLELALEDINRSILLNPKNGWAYRNKGIYFLKKGDYAQAIRLLNRAVKEPDFIDEVYYFLGLAQQQKGDLQQACLAWSKGKEASEYKSAELAAQYCD